MKLIIAAATLLAFTGAPADAQTIALHAGETVTIRVLDGNPIVESTAPAAAITAYESYALRRAQTQDIPPGVKIIAPTFLHDGEGPPDPPRPQPGHIGLTMRRVTAVEPGMPDNTELFIQNGYGSEFAYRAQLTRSGNSRPTDVCTVPANFLGLEHWPFVIDELKLSDLRLEPPKDTVSCE